MWTQSTVTGAEAAPKSSHCGGNQKQRNHLRQATTARSPVHFQRVIWMLFIGREALGGATAFRAERALWEAPWLGVFS